ncbi:gliding motility-associated C-terminal domain-containing protein [Mucilaginibacter sp. X5P1]|uniref:gliding motility-associated C-terminal domain-containing protein n=1 Tax=Mucilaginibacter sp. X5P1 TaxID=2723088 RepID=UPI0016150A8A|nr:gliding motility-associated C-terminal domain-containing protein [Mucilaginibacter sp. X5P1]MBB6140673.1 gliding motility-associated-like protein [Mucilaginibacter sp. X5P1]
MCWSRILFTLFGLFVACSTYAQSGNCAPPNIGFEEGTFNNWTCDTGKVDADGAVIVTLCKPVYDRHTIIDKDYSPKVDPFGKFPTLCPNGSNYSIRLGNQNAGAQAERVSYTFTVPAGADQYNLVFNYAVVLQNPQHLSFQQPRFTVKTYDISDKKYIECSSFDFIASSSLPGFQLATGTPDTAVYYKDWAPATINIQGYAGKQVRLEFTTNDCTLGGHFGYAYLDINESCNSPITGNTYCTGENAIKILAPGGFGSYIWYSADLSQVLGTDQALVMSPPPPDQTKYAVVLVPFAGLGCLDTLYTTVNSVNAGFSFVVKDTAYGCEKTGADITAPSITAGSSNNLTLSYYTDPFATSYLYQPQAILKSGTYYIEAINPEGCSNILPVQVIISNPIVTVTNPAPVTYPATIDASLTFTHDKNVSYTYFTDDSATMVLANYHYVGKTGTYYIKAVNAFTGCVTIAPVKVVIDPPPPPIIQAPNTFTPNNDGINDYFSLTIIGFGGFGSLKIFNRYGQPVFQTTSKYVPWDGKYNGKPVPVGTYYWMFEGKNTYYNTKVAQGGSITLIR